MFSVVSIAIKSPSIKERWLCTKNIAQKIQTSGQCATIAFGSTIQTRNSISRLPTNIANTSATCMFAKCRYYGKMFSKLRGELADVVACEGWMKMPCASQGCIHYLSADDMDKIQDWARKNNGLAGISPQIFSKYDVPATPELAYRYFTAIGDTENANRFGPPKDNDDWSDMSESKTLMNPKPSGLPIHDIVN